MSLTKGPLDVVSEPDRPARKDSGEKHEIDITPPMSRAGLRVFRERDAFDSFADETLEALLVEAFVAMESARGSVSTN